MLWLPLLQGSCLGLVWLLLLFGFWTFWLLFILPGLCCTAAFSCYTIMNMCHLTNDATREQRVHYDICARRGGGAAAGDDDADDESS